MMKRWLIGLVMVTVGLLSWMGSGVSAQAASLADGVYQVPMKIEQSKSVRESAANQFFAKTAVVKVEDQRPTVVLISNGGQYIQQFDLAKQPAKKVGTVNQQTLYQVQLTRLASPITATFKLVTPVGAMTESARLVLDWEHAQSRTTAVTTAALMQAANDLARQQKVKVETTKIPAKTATQSVRTTAKKVQPRLTRAQTQVTYWRYQVLKGSGSGRSQADRYFTDLAEIRRDSEKNYQVKLIVRYAKSLGLGPKAVVPEMVNGRPVATGTIHYQSTGDHYQMTYQFSVSRLQDLSHHLIPGKIHVTVPGVGLSQTFPIRFKFASHGAASADRATAVAIAVKGTQRASVTQHNQRATLPATGENTTQRAIMSLIGGIMVIGISWKLRGRHWGRWLGVASGIMLVGLMVPVFSAHAQSIDYHAYKYQTTNPSMASGYFVHPAQVQVAGQQYLVSVRMKTAKQLGSWPVTVESVAGQGPIMLHRRKDGKGNSLVDFSFKTSSLKQPVTLKLKIDVIHVYQATHRMSLQFQTRGLPSLQTRSRAQVTVTKPVAKQSHSPAKVESSEKAAAGSASAVRPKTSSSRNRSGSDRPAKKPSLSENDGTSADQVPQQAVHWKVLVGGILMIVVGIGGGSWFYFGRH